MSKKTFCNYPWHHLYVQTTGHFKICCLANEHITKDDGYHQYNLHNDRMSDAWNSKYMTETRKKMLSGERLSACQRCYDQEDKGLASMRNTQGYEDFMAATVDGRYKGSANHVELHFGNVCNLACKMCSQQYSHKVGQELLRIGDNNPGFVEWIKKESGTVNNWTAELGVVYDWFKNEKTKQNIFNYVSENVEGLTIVGGEPTAVKEFYELMDFCESKGTLKNKSFTLTTNMTNINKKMLSWFNQAKAITVYGSLDGVGDVNDYIRYPSDFSVIEKSIEFYAGLTSANQNIDFVIGPAFQTFNVHNLVDMVEYLEDVEQRHGIDIDIWWTGQVVAPSICDYVNMPDSYKQFVAEQLEKNLHRVKNDKRIRHIRTHIDLLRKPTDGNNPFKHKIIESFVKYNDLQDRYRKKKTWRELLPDLEKSIRDYLANLQV